MIFSFPVARSLPLSASWLASEAKEVSFAFLEETRGNQCRALSHTLGLGVQPGILGKTGIRAQVPFGIICSGPACVSGCGQAAEGVARLPWVLVGAELLPGARKELPPRTFTIAWCLRLAAHPLIVFGLLPWAGSYFEGLSENSEKNK